MMLNVATILPTLGVPELLVIFLILVLIFGANKLPQLGRGMGEGIRNFKKGLKSVGDHSDTPDRSDDESERPGGKGGG